MIDELIERVRDYLNEHDNPAPDYAYRHLLRERMRSALLSAIKAKEARE